MNRNIMRLVFVVVTFFLAGCASPRVTVQVPVALPSVVSTQIVDDATPEVPVVSTMQSFAAVAGEEDTFNRCSDLLDGSRAPSLDEMSMARCHGAVYEVFVGDRFEWTVGSVTTALRVAEISEAGVEFSYSDGWGPSTLDENSSLLVYTADRENYFPVLFVVSFFAEGDETRAVVFVPSDLYGKLELLNLRITLGEGRLFFFRTSQCVRARVTESTWGHTEVNNVEKDNVDFGDDGSVRIGQMFTVRDRDGLLREVGKVVSITEVKNISFASGFTALVSDFVEMSDRCG